MQSQTKNRQSREQIERMARRAFGVGLAASGDAVVEMTQGWFNAAYAVRLSDGREGVLKIAPPLNAEVMTYERNLLQTEVAALRLVHGHPAIPVPEVYAFDETRDLCDAAYFFMEKLAGDTLEQVKKSLAPDVRARLRLQIGTIVRAINSFTGDWFGYPGNPDLRAGNWTSAFLKIVESVLADGRAKRVDYGFSHDALVRAVHKHADALEEVRTPCLVHWDAWDPNFMIEDEKITGLLDFERALWADPLMEAQFRPFFGADAAEILRGYGKTAFTRNEERRSFLYTLHLGLVMITECAYRNYDSDRVENQGRAILANAMSWLETNGA